MSSPIACTLTLDELRRGAPTLLPGLATRAAGRSQDGDSLQLAFEPASEILAEIASVIDRERQCCAFLDFHLAVPAGHAPLLLTISGPPGTGEFLTQLLSVDASHG